MVGRTDIRWQKFLGLEENMEKTTMSEVLGFSLNNLLLLVNILDFCIIKVFNYLNLTTKLMSRSKKNSTPRLFFG